MFQWLFGSSNPTSSWQRNDSVPLVFDLERQTLSMVGLGDPIESLSFLGPGEDRFGWAFPERGVEFTERDGRVTEVTIYFGNATEADAGTFSGEILWSGQRLALSRETTEQQIAQLFGEPYHRDQDDDEILLFYEPDPEHEWQVELTLAGKLKGFTLSAPILSDPEQRSAYHVTQPYPHDPLVMRLRQHEEREGGS